eukprot:24854-Amorphochlora_amoeboformis.AAC.1
MIWQSEVERLRAEVSRLKAGQSIETFKHIKSHQIPGKDRERRCRMGEGRGEEDEMIRNPSLRSNVMIVGEV